jgi:hypothetical protein
MTKNSSQPHNEFGFGAFPGVSADVLDQMEAFASRMTQDALRIAKESLDASVALAEQWRKMTLDAARKTIERFETRAA